MADAQHPQTLLAYGMNGEALPSDFGAPVRLRLGRQLGYKNTKYLSRIIVTDDMDPYRKGPALGTAAFESVRGSSVNRRAESTLSIGAAAIHRGAAGVLHSPCASQWLAARRSRRSP